MPIKLPPEAIEPFTRAWRHRELIRAVARREFLSRFRGSALGPAWAVLAPLIMMLTYTVVFSVTVPQLADYKERIALYFEDAMIEIVFPSPYLNHQPTTVTVAKSDGHVLHKTELRGGYEEAFIEEMKGFWRAIVEGEPVRNTPEHAARDMRLLIGLAHHHAKNR